MITNQRKFNFGPSRSLIVACLTSFLLHVLLATLIFLVYEPTRPNQPKHSKSIQISLINSQDVQAIKQTQAEQQKPPAAQINLHTAGHAPSDAITSSLPVTKSKSTNPPVKAANITDEKAKPQEGLDPNNRKDKPQEDKKQAVTLDMTKPPADLEQLRLAVQARIYQAWQDQGTEYPSNQALGFTVELDELGYVKSINFGGGHRNLRPSIQAAVYAAQPFTELAGLSSSFSMYLVTTQEIYQVPGMDLTEPKEDP